jgi:hypothetical protein
MKRNSYNFLILIVIAALFSSCTKDLDREPIVGLTGANVYNSVSDYQRGIAGLYQKQNSNGYMFNYWFLEEVPTDEIVYTWDDGYTFQINNLTWSSNNAYVNNLYTSIYDIVTTANEFLRSSTDDVLAGKQLSSADVEEIRAYRAEARYLRALAYFHAINSFGNVPFVTEADAVGNTAPPQISRTDLFNYVESELKEIENALIPPRASYGRADKAAAWALLARLYLNAEVYTGSPRYTDCITYCNRIISSGAYSLDPVYQNVFLADNHLSDEMIFPFQIHPIYTPFYGTIMTIVHSQITADANPLDYGVGAGWLSLRTRPELVNLFTTPDGEVDKRGMFQTAGQTLEISLPQSNFRSGYGVGKFKNVTSTGEVVSDPTLTFVDIDFPVFRLGDIYLMYAESVIRQGSGGDIATAVDYINALRKRGFDSNDQDISAADLTLDFLFKERQREMYWEGTRRMDLIRAGKFTGNAYLWSLKGGVLEGTSIPDHMKLYPIPVDDLTVNPNLIQNPGY